MGDSGRAGRGPPFLVTLSLPAWRGDPPHSVGRKSLPWKITRSENTKVFQQPVCCGIGCGVSQLRGGAGTSGMFQMGRWRPKEERLTWGPPVIWCQSGASRPDFWNPGSLPSSPSASQTPAHLQFPPVTSVVSDRLASHLNYYLFGIFPNRPLFMQISKLT